MKNNLTHLVVSIYNGVNHYNITCENGNAHIVESGTFYLSIDSRTLLLFYL